MATSLLYLLGELQRLREEFGPGSARKKCALLARIAARSLSSAAEVLDLHELLCFWRAYPDSARVLSAVERQLRRFSRRPDLRRVSDELLNSGVAGTDTVYPFGLCTAEWLASRWGRLLTVEWEDVVDENRLLRALMLYALPAEVPGLDDPPLGARAWLDRLRAPGGTDAAYLVERAARYPAGTWARDRLFDELNVPMRIAAGPGSPNRTLARFDGAPVSYQCRPLDRARPDLRAEISRPPLAIRGVARRDAARLIDLAHESMVTRKRDLDAFAWADPRDVRLVDCGDGLQFALIGVLPERRFLFESVYGLLTLKNGVPIGYALTSALFESSEIAYNVFETFRGGEAGYVFGRLLAACHALFGSETFSIDPYQLGAGNEEGLDSGAWWFYYKLGFRPRARNILPLVAREARRVAANRDYRTARPTVERLVEHTVFWSAGPRREDVMGALRLGNVGLTVSALVARRFGSDRTRAAHVLADEAAATLDVAGWRRWSRDERLAWERWAPVVAVLPNVARWPQTDRAALVKVIRAKGGRRESAFVPLFNSHVRLRAAIVGLCRDTLSGSPSR
ncbi:MAG: hypothetical protein NTV05_08170 [Acidobacteria bacterium]|nr:hypothetical protein [Acidobacteriota bacterium]